MYRIVTTFYITLLFRTVLSARCSSSTVILSGSKLQKYTLMTPNYPSNYNSNDVCKWRIDAGSGNYVVLYATEFTLERNYDKLYVYEGTSMTSSALIATYTGTLTGSSLPFVRSTGQYLSLRFTSDSSVQNRGISAKFFSVENSAAAVDCITTNIAYSTPGQLVSTSFPSKYASTGRCGVLLDAGINNALSISVVYADIQYVTSTNCNNGGLSVHNGQLSSSATLLSLCLVPSSDYTNTVYTTGRYAYIEYKYSSSYQNRGFVIYYTTYASTVVTTIQPTVYTMSPATTSSCTTLASFTASQTVTNRITSPNYPSLYYNNLNCGYLITSSAYGYSSVRIQIEDFDLESSYDHLYIYDGISSSYTNLAASTISSGSIYTSTGSSIYVKFTTDGSVTRRGFSLSYTATQSVTPACALLYTQYLASTSIQSIQSPNYPSRYSSNIETYWLLVKPDIDDTLIYYFETFRLESDSGCNSYDYLVVYNGACITDSVIARYCGSQDNRKHRHTRGKYVLFKMKTDSSAEYAGFIMKYTIGSVNDDNETTINAGVITGAVVGSLVVLGKIGCVCFHIKSNRAATGKVSTEATTKTTKKTTLPSLNRKHDLVITPKTQKPKSQTNGIRSNYTVPQNLNVNVIPNQGPQPSDPPSSNMDYPPMSDPVYPPPLAQGQNNQIYMSYGGASSYPDHSVPNPFEYKPMYD